MHVVILGAGALGSLIGARLSGTDSAVTLLNTNREHAEAIRRHGLLIEELDGTVKRHELPCFGSPREISRRADLVIVLVKGYDTEKAVSGIGPCRQASTIFLTLQNGVGNIERIAGIVGEEATLAGSTAQGATLTAPGRIRHGGNGPTFIGEIHGPPTSRAQGVVELFRAAGLRTEASERMEQLIWEKLMINVGINAITALTGIRNGLIASEEPAREVCLAAVEEAVRVAGARGFPMGGDMGERVLTVARATAANRSSMGQDIDRKKRTEIDSINGAIVDLGEKKGIVTPVNRILTQLVRTAEAGFCLDKSQSSRRDRE